MRIGSGTPYYYVFDGLGSVVAVTDSNGVAQNTYKYEPYGATATATGTVPNPWQFAAGYHDTTGWYKFGMRYYSGRLGRWSQLDPKEQPTDPRQQNRFGYAGGDPVNASDPTGLCVAGFIGFDCNAAGVTDVGASHIGAGVYDAAQFGYAGGTAGATEGFSLGYASAYELGVIPAAFIGGISGVAGAAIVGVPSAAAGGAYGLLTGDKVSTGGP